MADSETITPHELRFERELDAPVETVWQYLVDSDKRARWFMPGNTDARAGGKMRLTFAHAGLSDADVPTPERFAGNVGQSWEETITRIDPPHLLAFSWSGGDAGEVTITLAPLGDQRTRLTLVHGGLRGADDARNFGGGWLAHLAALQARLAGRGVPDFWALHRESEAKAAAIVG